MKIRRPASGRVPATTPRATATTNSVTTNSATTTPTTEPPLPAKATKALPLGLTSMTRLALRQKVAARAWALPQLAPFPKTAAVASSGAALAGRLSALTHGDVAGHNYDTFVFAAALAAHTDGTAVDDVAGLIAAFRTFAPGARAAFDDDGGSSCVGHCLSLVQRLRAQGLPAFVVPVEHAAGERLAHEPPFAHVAAVVPFVEPGEGPNPQARRGVVVCDTGANVGVPVVLLPGLPVSVLIGRTGRSWTYELAKDGATVSCTRPRSQSAGGGDETTVLHLVELLNPDSVLTRPYASMNPRVTLCRRDRDGAVVASVVVDLERGVVRLSAGGKKVALDVNDPGSAAALDAVVSDDFARLLRRPRLRQEIAALLAAAPRLNALRAALEGGAA